MFTRSVKVTPLIYVFIFMIFSFLNPSVLKSQVLTKSIIDLRTKIKNHKWSFHPGDSPVIIKKMKGEILYTYTEDAVDDTRDNESIHFTWADPVLRKEDKKGWIDDIQIQLAWTRYRDKNNNRPFKDFNKYSKDYKGYGWYRTTFNITKEDLKKRFKSKELVLRLGEIGQADAVYLNGYFIGGTGLKHNTPMGTVLDDNKLYYSKTRYYNIPAELIKYNAPNILSVRVFAKYNIAPGLSHGKYYIASSKKVERSKFWDNFKKTFVIVLTILLGIFYLYWQILFREDDHATIYFALTAFAMAVNTFMQSQVVYSIWGNALWIKKIEFVSLIIFVHLLLEFLIHFTKTESSKLKIINRLCDLLGIAAVAAVLVIPSMVTARRFMFAWGVAPAILTLYMIFIIFKGRKIPSMTTVSIGFYGMVILLLNDALIGFQFRWVVWEISFKDYGFAFFAMMAAASIVSNMKKSRELIERQKKEKARLSKYFSPDVVDSILDGEVSLGGEEKPIVTLFADIVGFTSYSEKHTPADVVSKLNEMFSRISKVIFKYTATLDKYIGDCIMAFWGSPKATPLDAHKAIACAIDMIKVCNEIDSELPEGEEGFQLRIGINLGSSIVGNIGSDERMDYTVIGDAVNTASRIESNGIPGKVAVSESAFEAAGGDEYIKYTETREITVKGKTQPLKIYLVEEVLERTE